METENRLNTELRRMKRLRQLGDRPACALCGENNPEALTQAKRSLLENHHIAGEANNREMTIVLCLNHHRVVTEKQRQCGVELWRQPRNLLERLINVLKGIASCFLTAGEILQELAASLAKAVKALDGAHPDWRMLPEMK